jgi:hypothetical protein
MEIYLIQFLGVVHMGGGVNDFCDNCAKAIVP